MKIYISKKTTRVKSNIYILKNIKNNPVFKGSSIQKGIKLHNVYCSSGIMHIHTRD